VATQTIVNAIPAERTDTSAAFDRFAGVCGILAGVVGLLYSVAFVVLKEPMLYSLCLLLGGLLSGPVLIALYSRLRSVDPQFAVWGLMLGLAGTLGSITHGGFDLANSINPPRADVFSDANLPNIVDPRSLLTFGVAGIGMLTFSWLLTRHADFPRGLGYLGYVLGALLIVLYLGRLIILDAGSYAILLPAALAGFLVNPAWYIWAGLTLRKVRS
jgi:hypothetical protein